MDGGRDDLTRSTYERFTGSKYQSTQEQLWEQQNMQLDGLSLLNNAIGYAYESVLQEADRIINGVRDQDYGTPEDNFKTIGELWSTVLTFRSGTRTVVSSQDVAMLMILVKVARNLNKPSRDNLVDVAGYAGCAAKIAGFDQ